MTIESLFETLIKFGIVLLIVIVMFGIFYVIVKAIMLPIERKKYILDKVDHQKSELDQILIQKGIEWDSYKQVVDERDVLRRNYLQLKKEVDLKQEEKAKLEIHVDNLRSVNAELKKKTTPADASETVKTKAPKDKKLT